jgi:hypothetical protein
MKVPQNSTFYEVMTFAAQQDNHFTFEYQTYSFGRFITKIANHSQSTEENYFWMLYEYPDTRGIKIRPVKEQLSEVGVDLLIVKNKFRYLFWLQHFVGDH